MFRYGKMFGHFKNDLPRTAYYFENLSGRTKSRKVANCNTFRFVFKTYSNKMASNRIVKISFLMDLYTNYN